MPKGARIVEDALAFEPFNDPIEQRNSCGYIVLKRQPKKSRERFMVDADTSLRGPFHKNWLKYFDCLIHSVCHIRADFLQLASRNRKIK